MSFNSFIRNAVIARYTLRLIGLILVFSKIPTWRFLCVQTGFRSFSFLPRSSFIIGHGIKNAIRYSMEFSFSFLSSFALFWHCVERRF